MFNPYALMKGSRYVFTDPYTGQAAILKTPSFLNRGEGNHGLFGDKGDTPLGRCLAVKLLPPDKCHRLQMFLNLNSRY